MVSCTIVMIIAAVAAVLFLGWLGMLITLYFMRKPGPTGPTGPACSSSSTRTVMSAPRTAMSATPTDCQLPVGFYSTVSTPPATLPGSGGVQVSQAFNGTPNIMQLVTENVPNWNSNVFTVPSDGGGAYVVNAVFNVSEASSSPLVLQYCTSSNCGDSDWIDVASVIAGEASLNDNYVDISINTTLLLSPGNKLRFYAKTASSDPFSVKTGTVDIFNVITSATPTAAKSLA